MERAIDSRTNNLDSQYAAYLASECFGHTERERERESDGPLLKKKIIIIITSRKGRKWDSTRLGRRQRSGQRRTKRRREEKEGFKRV